MPHWKPPWRMKASCSGLRWSASGARPSTVVTCESWTITAGSRHEDTSWPLTSTEHAPQTPTLQPSLVPVMPRSSRSRCSNKRLAGMVTVCACPFTVSSKVWSLTRLHLIPQEDSAVFINFNFRSGYAYRGLTWQSAAIGQRWRATAAEDRWGHVQVHLVHEA